MKGYCRYQMGIRNDSRWIWRHSVRCGAQMSRRLPIANGATESQPSLHSNCLLPFVSFIWMGLSGFELLEFMTSLMLQIICT